MMMVEFGFVEDAETSSFDGANHATSQVVMIPRRITIDKALVDDVDSQIARDFTGSSPAHAVTHSHEGAASSHDVNAILLTEAARIFGHVRNDEGVFVVFADTPDIGTTKDGKTNAPIRFGRGFLGIGRFRIRFGREGFRLD